MEMEAAPEIWAEVDETFYIRMVVNLISNALRYSRGERYCQSDPERNGRHVYGECAGSWHRDRAGRPAACVGNAFIRRMQQEQREAMQDSDCLW